MGATGIKSYIVRSDTNEEIRMFFPLKFVAANIFMAGVTAGAVGGAAAVYVLSDQQRREKLEDCAEKMRENCKTKWNTKPTVPTQ